MSTHHDHSPSLSVVIATKDRFPLVRETVLSVLAQERLPEEILIVNDGSDRATADWLALAEQEVDILRSVSGPRKGVGAARQMGLQCASGEYVCVLDSDDELLPGAVTELAQAVRRGAHVIYGHMIETRDDGTAKLVRFPAYKDNAAMRRAIFLRPRIPFKHSGVTMDRRFALGVGGYDPKLRMKVDIDLMLRLLSAGARRELVDRALVRFLMHRDGMSFKRLAGIGIWCDLIDQHGPPGRVAKLGYKAVRGANELTKWLVGSASLPETSTRNHQKNSKSL